MQNYKFARCSILVWNFDSHVKWAQIEGILEHGA
jgi:hypothetical protein